MEALLKSVLPDVDVDSPTFDEDVSPQSREKAKANLQPPIGTSVGPNKSPSGKKEPDSLLEPMVEATGRLDLDDQGNWDFHGHSSGIAFLARMKEQFGDLIETGFGQNTLLRLKPIPQLLYDSPRSVGDSPLDSELADTSTLPTKEVARQLTANALDDACSLMRFIHRPSFEEMLDRIYDIDPQRYTNEEHKFLPLLYIVLALGCLFSKCELQKSGVEHAMQEGYVPGKIKMVHRFHMLTSLASNTS
jgi:hypothetical protein